MTLSARTLYHRKWRAANLERVRKSQRKWRLANQDKIIASRHKHELINLERYLLGRIRIRCAKQGIKFNLTMADVGPMPKYCPVFGIKIKRGKGQSGPNSPTLDRLDPKKGYVKGNVAWISSLANQMKSNATAAQHRRIADWIDEFTATHRSE